MDRTRNKIIVILFFLFAVLVLLSSFQTVTKTAEIQEKTSSITHTPDSTGLPTGAPTATSTPTQIPVQQPNFRINGVGGEGGGDD